VITQPSRAPFGSVIAQLGRVLAATSAAPPPASAIPSYDPVFLPDCVLLTPDQAQELRYGKGRLQ
jgi:hypothetical protein